MSTGVNRTTLKTYFNTGDKPTQSNFEDLIDSCLNDAEDSTATGRITLSGSLGNTPGTGITGVGTTTVKTSCIKIGDIITTTIITDLTGLASNVAADIIGKAGGTANSHFGQITAAVNGTIMMGSITCLETPTTGTADIDMYTATVATGAEDALVTDLDETVVSTAAGDFIGTGITSTYCGVATVPPADGYLYLANGGSTADGTYDAGKFLIQFYGYTA